MSVARLILFVQALAFSLITLSGKNLTEKYIDVVEEIDRLNA